jgi:hypothetical protein
MAAYGVAFGLDKFAFSFWPSFALGIGIGTLTAVAGLRRPSHMALFRHHTAFQSGRIGPDMPSNAPSTSSQTGARNEYLAFFAPPKSDSDFRAGVGQFHKT